MAEKKKQKKFTVGQEVWYMPGSRWDSPRQAVVEQVGNKYVYLVGQHDRYDAFTGVLVTNFGAKARILTMEEKADSEARREIGEKYEALGFRELFIDFDRSWNSPKLSTKCLAAIFELIKKDLGA